MVKRSHRHTPLIDLIAWSTEQEALAYLASRPESAFERDDDDTSPLQVAILSEKRSIFLELLKSPEDITRTDRWGNTALWTAAYHALLVRGTDWFLRALLPVFNDVDTENNVGKGVIDMAERAQPEVRELLESYSRRTLPVPGSRS